MLSKMESEETQKKIAQLQSLEQNLQNFLMQKQTFQSQLIEIENALDEIEKSSGNVYKIVGSVMISSKKDDVALLVAPFQILLGTISPGGCFGAWLRSYLANLAVFPTVGILFVLSYILALAMR